VGRDEDIILASTYEAKARGVKTGTPAREAKRILGKDIVLIKPDMHYYQETSKKIMAILASEANDIEVYSVDEAFIDITHHLQIEGDEHTRYTQRARAIQQRVYDELGISVSIGLAPTRLLAKMFAGMRKPYGITIGMNIEEIHARIRHLPITEIPFISRKRAMRLSRCQTVGDFLDADIMYIKEIMGGS
jgi:DNA polymerase-4